MRLFGWLLLLGACQEVRAEDVQAWRRVPVLELEKHTHFSTLPKQTQPLSDGSELWDYVNCTNGKTPTECTSSKGVNDSVQTSCTGGQEFANCCHNQFVVRAGFVEEYRPVGNCYTDCFKRPGGVCK